MKVVSIMMLILSSAFALDLRDVRCSSKHPLTDRNDNKINCLCKPPHQDFIEGKLKESFVLSDGEQELKEIVKDPNNYPYREELKALYRRLSFATRPQKGIILQEIGTNFDRIIDGAKRGRSIANFPMEGATSEMSSVPGSIVLTIRGLSREELTFLPKPILDKLGNTVKIHYTYPVEHFDYFLSYEGKEIPMKKAFARMQEEFEVHCVAQASENEDIRLANRKDRQKRYGSSVSGQ